MRLKVTTSPHIKNYYSTSYLMRQVIVGLFFPVIASLIFFKMKAFIVIIWCIIGCALAEYLWIRLNRLTNSLWDYSALVSAILLALSLPPETKWWMCVIGGFFAILVCKEFFGGLGYNIFNPALGARAFLMANFPVALTTWRFPYINFKTLGNIPDTFTYATPLALWKFDKIIFPLKYLFLGIRAGSLGETCVLAIIIGGFYIIFRKIADWRAPLGMFLSMTFLAPFYIWPNTGNFFNDLFISICFNLFSGGALLGMFFMITDPVTTPITKTGR
ncbi:MAG: RnfABCDGE type electron transport complex subunit D [Candidatus Aenigmatarchaeota archaeon]